MAIANNQNHDKDFSLLVRILVFYISDLPWWEVRDEAEGQHQYPQVT